MPLLALVNKGTIRIYDHIDQNHPQLEIHRPFLPIFICCAP